MFLLIICIYILLTVSNMLVKKKCSFLGQDILRAHLEQLTKIWSLSYIWFENAREYAHKEILNCICIDENFFKKMKTHLTSQF